MFLKHRTTKLSVSLNHYKLTKSSLADTYVVTFFECVLDVIGVCKRVGELAWVTTKRDGKKISKRELILVDESNVEIPVTIWGNLADEFNEQNNPVIAFKSVRVGNFYGKNLSMNMNSTMAINPDLEEAKRLRQWFDLEGKFLESTSLSLAAAPGGKSHKRTTKSYW